MLKLINIRKNRDLIEADYIPENSDVKAHVSIDLKTRRGNAESLNNYSPTYGRMAINGLQKTMQELEKGTITKIPDEKLVMWY